ncbi:multicopper oxidase domain-containing protein [Terrabacter carboxydivorans]|uniref:Plastocyanin-like domain-containing protein n=1 Tax=Terrabacter carboxydivorans TaxID=619730 RepID=A0ABP5ZCX6_9MICO
MTSRHSLRHRLGVTAAAAALATVPFAGTAFAATTAYAVSPAPGLTSAAGVAGSTAPAAVRSAPTAAVGKLTPNTPGCTVTPAAAPDPEIVTCDLWASAGTNQVLGQSIPIWGYSTTQSGTPTAPGPAIIARQGDRVVLTLHNELGEPTSLALPGQPASSFSEGLPTDAATTGIDPHTTARYVFTASRAGTFLYEAGHTSGGARQVAMGLAGAFVVLGDGTAYGQSYDDESVLVLSEIDPALNANPATFDMREFHPAYRLINGKPFPSTDPVPTDQGHTVLLRYVNAGSELHAMNTLGTGQTVLSHDGHGLAFPEPSVVVPVDPGVTVDALVTVPSGPESKIAVYESSGRLDNAGQSTADPLSVAFGGMLTFLDTNAPPPTTDGVGPVSTGIAVTPNPSDGTSAVTVTATVSDATTGNHAVSGAELVVDDAVTVGPGFGLALTGTFGTTSASVTGTIPASATATQCASTAPPLDLHCLTSTKHTIFVRGLDSEGNWGVVGSVILNLAKTGPQTVGLSVSPTPASGKGDVTVNATGDDTAAGGTITDAEYFLGAAAGADGTGTAMTLNRSATKVAETGTIPAATVKGLGEGTAQVWVHSRNSQHIWGPAVPVDLTVDLTAPAVNAATVGPNPTNGVLGSQSYPGYLVISAQLDDRDAGGAAQSPVLAGEAFIDPTSTTPSFGSGLTLIAVDGAFDSTKEDVYGLIPLTQVRAMTAGEHKVYVHGRDAAGNWGSLTSTNALVRLYVDKTAPILGTLTGSPNPTNGAATLTLTGGVTETPLASYVGPRFQGAEFWTGTTDPGVGKATRVQVTDTGTGVTAAIPLTGLPAGTVQFNLRVQDAAGNWSNASSVSVTVVRANAIFSDTFDAALSAWTARTGSVAGTTAAASSTAAGNVGLAATVGSGNAPAYVTDESPANESTYHAQFRFNPNTLSTGGSATAWTTVFEGRTATGQAFAVQYHRAGTSRTAAQLRIVMNRNTIGNTTGPAYTLTSGAHTVRVDWAQGTGGSLRLLVDGTLRDTRTGNNTGPPMQVQSVRLGVTAGPTTASTMAGQAWFDDFTSTRNSLP